MTKIVVDGYNMIRQVRRLSQKENLSLQAGRDFLIKLLATYKKQKLHQVTIVFDGQSGLSEFASSHKEQGIEVCFAPHPVCADDVICQMAEVEKNRLIVVSSDNAVINFAKKQGCGIIKSPDFYEKLLFANTLTHVSVADAEPNKAPHKRWTTYKKGPSKRLPKKLRQNQQKLNKL